MKLSKKIKRIIISLLCISMLLTNIIPTLATENESLPVAEEVINDVVENEKPIAEEVVEEEFEDDFNKIEEFLEENISSPSEIIEDEEEAEEDIDLSLIEEPEEDVVEVAEELKEDTAENVEELEIEASPSDADEELEDIDSNLDELEALDIAKTFGMEASPSDADEELEDIDIASTSEIEVLDTKLFGGSPGDTVYWYYTTYTRGYVGTVCDLILTTAYTSSFDDEGHTFTRGGIYTNATSITGISATMVTQLKIYDDIYPTSLHKYFYHANVGQILGMEKLHTDYATDMSYMFANNNLGYNFKNLNISLLNTTGITDMSHMFEGCTNVEKLDVSSFDTSSVTTMDNMFSDCTGMRILIGKENFVPSGASGTDMFSGCSNLMGCKGTAYSATKTDKSMAVIDKLNGSSTPGYFSKKVVAKLNGYEYTSLYNAINDVNDSETIQVIDDIDEIIETESITIDNGKTFTIDFKEASGTQHSFTYGAKNITSSPKPIFHISNASNVTINNMNYENKTGSATGNKDTLFKIEGSSILKLDNFTNVNRPATGKCDSLLDIDSGSVTLVDSYFAT